MHVILDCPKITPGAFTHLKSPPLDSGNRSGQLLLNNGGKGFTSQNCFLFDTFPRRCNFKSTLACRSPREKWPALREAHDCLHTYWRSRGGKVVLIMGGNAEKAYNDVAQQDHIEKESVFTTETFNVWVERSQVISFTLNKLTFIKSSKEIQRVVVKVFHPAYFLYNQGKRREAISMDNGCNFAAAMAGVDDLLDHDFFYRGVVGNRYHLLHRCLTSLQSVALMVLNHKVRMNGPSEQSPEYANFRTSFITLHHYITIYLTHYHHQIV